MAFTSAKMGLRIWNLLTDLYDHAQLADNWAKVDYHDHSPGKGVQIPTEGIADAAVTAAKLSATTDPSGAYTSGKMNFRAGGGLVGSAAAGTYILRNDFGALTVVPVPAATSAIYLDPNDWTASGRVVRYVLRASLLTNAVAPTASYQFAMFPVATWGGASGVAPTVATVGAAVTGSTSTTIAAPPATTMNGPTVTEFDAPAAGWYVLGLIQTGASVANANVTVFGTLLAKQV
jgi:hypothetical protein